MKSQDLLPDFITPFIPASRLLADKLCLYHEERLASSGPSSWSNQSHVPILKLLGSTLKCSLPYL